MRLRWAPVLMLSVSCRQQLQVDTSEAMLIPRDFAVDGLKALLATADAAECTQPKHCLRRDEITEWVVDEAGLEARAEGKTPIRVEFKDVTATRLDKVALYYQVRLFTPGQPNPEKHYVHFNWTLEGTARRTLELVDALCRKSTARLQPGGSLDGWRWKISPGRRLGEPLELLDPRMEIVDMAVHDRREARKPVGTRVFAQRLEGNEPLFPREQQGL